MASFQLMLDLRDRFFGVPCVGSTTVVRAKTALGFVQPKFIHVFIVSRFQALDQSKSELCSLPMRQPRGQFFDTRSVRFHSLTVDRPIGVVNAQNPAHFA